MEESLTIINDSGSTRGSCNSTGCGTCAPAPSASEAPATLSRREFGVATLFASAGTLLSGCSKSPAPEQAAQPAPASPAQGSAPMLSPDLEVVKESKSPIMTTLEEFYKIGPGPSSSHAMGPMRITYDFLQRFQKPPEDQLRRATALQVHLFGSLSATGIERCAYGAVKAWTGYSIASGEIPEERRVDLDTTIAAMALTAKEMNSNTRRLQRAA